MKPHSSKEWLASFLVLTAGLGFLYVANQYVPDETTVTYPTPAVTPSEVATTAPPNIVDEHALLADSEPTTGSLPTDSPTLQPILKPVVGEGQKQVVKDRLAPILAQVPVDGSFGVAVISPDSEVVINHYADTPLTPASTIKTASMAAVWTLLGADTTLKTYIRADNPPNENGVINGNIYVYGAGDPSFMSELAVAWKIRPPRPTTSIGFIADQIRDLGITQITGSIVGVNNLFTPETTAIGWKDNYLWEQSASHIRPLSVDRGITFVPRIGESKEHDYAHAVYHPSQVIGIDTKTIDTATSFDSSLDMTKALKESLIGRGVIVGGESTVTNENPQQIYDLITIESPPIKDLVAWTMMRSDNHMADMLVRTLGATRGEGSFENGASVVKVFLADLGVDLGGIEIHDGSGLSVSDKISPKQLAEFTQLMSVRDTAWKESLALMGVSGTTRSRLKDTPAQGRFYGKTGSIEGVASYVGVIADSAGQLWSIAIMSNNKSLTGKAYEYADALLVALSEALPQ